MTWSVIGALQGVRHALPTPHGSVRMMHQTSVLARKSGPGRGRARKSPNTLLRLHAEGKLRGAEALQAARLVEEERFRSSFSGKSDESAHPSDTMTLSDARQVIRAVDAARPRNAYELHIVTSVPSNQTNAFRGRLTYPRDPRIKGETVLVFADQDTEAAQAAEQVNEELKASGSSTRLIVGGQELIGETSSGRVPSYTRVLCTSALLPSLSKALARTLGPKGLMPNVKRGTVANDGEEMRRAIDQLVTGVDWRGDRVGVVRGAVGRISFSEADLRANVQAFLDAVIARAASGLTGTKVSVKVVESYARDVSSQREDGTTWQRRGPGAMKRAQSIIKDVYLSSTQGPGIRLRLEDVL